MSRESLCRDEHVSAVVEMGPLVSSCFAAVLAVVVVAADDADHDSHVGSVLQPLGLACVVVGRWRDG